MVYYSAQKRYSLKQLFMIRDNKSTDGFILRKRVKSNGTDPRQRNLSSVNVPSRFLDSSAQNARPLRQPNSADLHSPSGLNLVSSSQQLVASKLNREKIGIDLNLDDDPPKKKFGGFFKKGRKKQESRKDRNNRLRKKWSRKKKIIVAIIAILIVAILGVGGYFIYKFLYAGNQIFSGNVISAIFDEAQPLQEDENGRSNILLFGTSEDDADHPGANLTDSIMVVSINQTTNEAYIVSIPRDLHVKYGQSCDSGTEGKINVIYSCNQDLGEEAAAAALSDKVGEVLGLDIQYAVHVNYTVLKEAVDAVGGITVTIESDDSRGILDRNFDWMCNYTCYYVKYENGPATLDGIHALALARARGDSSPTYGLSRSNPDREDNQRKILIALKDKAVSAGVLANPVAVNNLLTTLGNNLRTNFAADEIKTLIQLGQDVATENITSFSLEDSDNPLATANCFSGDICPNAGNYDYSDIQAAVYKLSTTDAASKEGATIDVFNASGTTGLAQTQADELTAKNLTVGTVDTVATSLGTEPIMLYDLSGGTKPATLQKLKDLLGVEVTSTTLPSGVTSTANFVVIVGKQD